MSASTEIMKLSKKFRTYDAISYLVNYQKGDKRYSHGTIDRAVRRLVAKGLIESKFKKGKNYKMYRQV